MKGSKKKTTQKQKPTATNTATNTATSSKTKKPGRTVRKTAQKTVNDKKQLGNGGFCWKRKGSRSGKTSHDIEKDRNTGLGRTAQKKKEEEQDVEDFMRELVPQKSIPARCGECGKQCKSEQGLKLHRKVSVSLEIKN